MLRISKKLAKLLVEEQAGDKLGYFDYAGAVVGDAEFVLYYKDTDKNHSYPYLAHTSEFEWQGILIKLKGE